MELTEALLLVLPVFLAGLSTALLFFIPRPYDVDRWCPAKKILLGGFMVGTWLGELGLCLHQQGFSATALYYICRAVAVSAARISAGNANSYERDVPEMLVLPFVFPAVIKEGLVESFYAIVRNPTI